MRRAVVGLRRRPRDAHRRGGLVDHDRLDRRRRVVIAVASERRAHRVGTGVRRRRRRPGPDRAGRRAGEVLKRRRRRQVRLAADTIDLSGRGMRRAVVGLRRRPRDRDRRRRLVDHDRLGVSRRVVIAVAGKRRAHRVRARVRRRRRRPSTDRAGRRAREVLKRRRRRQVRLATDTVDLSGRRMRRPVIGLRLAHVITTVRRPSGPSGSCSRCFRCACCPLRSSRRSHGCRCRRRSGYR